LPSIDPTATPSHALIVRPIDGGYQIISGHHRVKAAERAGLASVPCWVREYSDADAYMQLVLCNTQSELHALEEGKHAAESGMDLKAYAEASGKAYDNLYKKLRAYIVFAVCHVANDYQPEAFGDGIIMRPSGLDVSRLRESWRNLAEIHAAPEWLWPALVSQMVGDRVMPSAKPEALRDAMANCDSRSPKHFRMTVESWPDEHYRSVSLSNETATEEAPEPEITEETAPEPVNSQPETETESVIQEEDVKMPACTAL
jgi:hypothetical protein